MRILKSLSLILTTRCNEKCRYCDIGRYQRSAEDLSIADIRALFNDSLVRQSYRKLGSAFDISIGGGEPFLYPYLDEAVDLIERILPGSFKCITTNGMCLAAAVRFVQKYHALHFKINVSIDGIGAVHDSIRGVPGAFVRTLKTVQAIRRLFPPQPMEIKMTIFPENVGHIQKVYELARQLHCGFVCKPGETMPSYTNRREPARVFFTRQQLCLIRRQLFSVSDALYKEKEFKKAEFIKDVPFYLFAKKKKNRCSVLEHQDLMILPDGSVVACVKEPCLGNMRKRLIGEIVRKRNPHPRGCSSCMLMCGAYKDYAKNYMITPARVMVTSSKRSTAGQGQPKYMMMRFAVLRRLLGHNPRITHISLGDAGAVRNPALRSMTDYLDSLGITYEMQISLDLLTRGVVSFLSDCAGLKKVAVFCMHGDMSKRSYGLLQKLLLLVPITVQSASCRQHHRGHIRDGSEASQPGQTDGMLVFDPAGRRTLGYGSHGGRACQKQ